MGPFAKAVKHESKLRLAVTGPSGSGKTYTSLAIAAALADGKPVAVVDTEHGSASKYADLFAFDVVNMEAPFHPDRFVEMIREAGKAGYGVIVLDSLTHAWQGTGGMLDLVDEIAKRKTGGNGFAAWKDATPIQNRMIEAIVGAPIHVIATLRSKQDYVQDKDDRGKTTIKKVGMAAQQREGFEYEFDVVMDMDIDNNGIVSKTRCPALTGRVFSKPGRDVANILADWLRGAPAPAQSEASTQPKEGKPQSNPAAPATATTTGNGAAGNGNGRVKTTWGEVSEQAAREHAGDLIRENDQAAALTRAFMARGTELFGKDWEAARHWLIEKYTEKETPSNVRRSSKELEPGEIKAIKAWLDDYPKGIVKQWEARRAELDAITVDAAPELNPDAAEIPA